MEKGEVILYQPNETIKLEVRLEAESVWLTQAQMADLFQKDRTVISRHIRNVFKEGELDESLVCAKFALPKKYGRRKGYMQEAEATIYNLDVIISVGYRVKSQRGVQFRQWANRVLKQYLIKGYAVNERIRHEQINELRQLVQVVGRTIQHSEHENTIETQDLLDVVVDYTYALDTLDNYDYERLTIDKTTKVASFHATYENAMEQIQRLRHKFGAYSLFGNEKDDSFKSSIGQIYQTFGGEELYPSVEEKAAMLLYLVTKNHSFSDGNKRIADSTLVALTLMIAESKTEEKDVMVKVVVNLINQRN